MRRVNYRQLTEKQIKKIVEEQVRKIIVYHGKGFNYEHLENELSDIYDTTSSSICLAINNLVNKITDQLINDEVFFDYASKEVVSGKKKSYEFIYTLMDWEKEPDVDKTIKSKVTEEDINKLQETIKETMVLMLFDEFLDKNLEEQDDTND